MDTDDSRIEAALHRLKRAPDDQSAWTTVVQASWAFVQALCRRKLGAVVADRVGVDDVTQEVFLKFSRYWHGRRPQKICDRGSLFASLAVIGAHVATDAARAALRQRRDMTRERSIADYRNVSGPAARVDPAADMDLRELLKRFDEVLDAQQRKIVALRLQEYSVPEIAQRLGVSARTIERALQGVRSLLGPLIADDG